MGRYPGYRHGRRGRVSRGREAITNAGDRTTRNAGGDALLTVHGRRYQAFVGVLGVKGDAPAVQISDLMAGDEALGDSARRFLPLASRLFWRLGRCSRTLSGCPADPTTSPAQFRNCPRGFGAPGGQRLVRENGEGSRLKSVREAGVLGALVKKEEGKAGTGQPPRREFLHGQKTGFLFAPLTPAWPVRSRPPGKTDAAEREQQQRGDDDGRSGRRVEFCGGK